MPSKHVTDRLVPFTDAVVAIAITLLILPLVEIGQAAETVTQVGDSPTFLGVLQNSVAPFIGFAISFFVIARLWWAHHAIFEDIHEWTNGMVIANIFWLFTIVLLPWVTTFATTFLENRLVNLFYVGTMTASSALQTVMARLVVRVTPSDGANRVRVLERYYGNLTTLVAFLVALILCIAIPASYYTPLTLLAFTGLVDRQVNRRLEKAHPDH